MQFIKVGTKIAGTKATNLSFVQGSGLGPCLFNRLNNICNGTTNHMVKYADDTTLHVLVTKSQWRMNLKIPNNGPKVIN